LLDSVEDVINKIPTTPKSVKLNTKPGVRVSCLFLPHLYRLLTIKRLALSFRWNRTCL